MIKGKKENKVQNHKEKAKKQVKIYKAFFTYRVSPIKLPETFLYIFHIFDFCNKRTTL